VRAPRVPGIARRAATAVAALAALAACGGEGGGVVDPPGGAAGRVRVTANRTATIDEVSAVTLAAEVRTAAGAPVPGAAVTWDALEPGVATVGADGVVRGVAPGVARVVARAAGAGAVAPDTAVVTVEPAAVARVVAADTALPAALAVGDTGTVTAGLVAAGGAALAPTHGRAVTWASGDPGVLAVTPDGRVTARAAGTAVLTATSGPRTGGAPGTPGGGATTTLPVTVAAAPFRVALTLEPSVTPAVAEAARAAARRWERVVARGSAAPLDRRTPTCDPYAGLAAGRFAVTVRVAPSGAGPNTAEAAQACLRTDYQGAAVVVTVDPGLAARAEAGGPGGGGGPDVAAVLAHEVGHGLGLGGWRYGQPAPMVDAGLTAFTGAQAAAAWQAMGGGGFAPLQVGAPGPVSHWSHAGGLCGELLAPVVTRDSRLSAVTLAALVDLGWAVRAERAEAYTRRTC
jgi:hypothetical protein